MHPKSDFHRIFGERVRALRHQRGMSQAQLAEATDVTPLTISNIERGTHPPSFYRLERLARGLEVEVHELFLFEETVERP